MPASLAPRPAAGAMRGTASTRRHCLAAYRLQLFPIPVASYLPRQTADLHLSAHRYSLVRAQPRYTGRFAACRILPGFFHHGFTDKYACRGRSHRAGRQAPGQTTLCSTKKEVAPKRLSPVYMERSQHVNRAEVHLSYFVHYVRKLRRRHCPLLAYARYDKKCCFFIQPLSSRKDRFNSGLTSASAAFSSLPPALSVSIPGHCYFPRSSFPVFLFPSTGLCCYRSNCCKPSPLCEWFPPAS